MKFIPVRELRSNPAKIWKRLPKEGPMVVTSHGKPVAMLTACNEQTFERTLDAERTRKAMEAVESMRRHAKERGLDKLSMDEIDAIISETRRERVAREARA